MVLCMVLYGIVCAFQNLLDSVLVFVEQRQLLVHLYMYFLQAN